MYSGLFHVTFFIFRILQHFVPKSAFAQKVKRLLGLFFCVINKTHNSHEIREVYSECFVFRGVFRKNIRKIPVNYEKCVAGVWLSSHDSSSVRFRFSTTSSPLDFNPAGCMLDSVIPPSPNHVEVNPCVGCLLHMLKVERREYCTRSESHGG